MMKMHLSLRVSDVRKAQEFYTAFFGVAPHKIRTDYVNYELTGPPLKLALNQTALQSGAGSLDHLGFQVTNASELETIKERLKAAGLATFDEADTVCCYARQDKVWVRDPDGNEWEIYVLTDELDDDASTEQDGPMTMQPAHRCCG